jgi:hypothetical protein
LERSAWGRAGLGRRATMAARGGALAQIILPVTSFKLIFSKILQI